MCNEGDITTFTCQHGIAWLLNGTMLPRISPDKSYNITRSPLGEKLDILCLSSANNSHITCMNSLPSEDVLLLIQGKDVINDCMLKVKTIQIDQN